MRILTIDLEDWFHILDFSKTENPEQWSRFESRVERNTNYLLNLLEEKNKSATWFCLGWIAAKHPDLIRQVSAKHEIACHSDLHQLVYQQSPDQFRKDLQRSIRTIEDVTGKKVKTYRAPGFSFTPQVNWMIDVLAEEGIEVDCSVFPAKRNHGGYPGLPQVPHRIQTSCGHLMKELPIGFKSLPGFDFVFSGGGYFRVLPYGLIKKWTRETSYTMTYFHPRDFDSEQPVLKGLSMKRRWMSYHGLKTCSDKFKKYLNDFDFVTVEEAVSQIDWESTKLVELSVG